MAREENVTTTKPRQVSLADAEGTRGKELSRVRAQRSLWGNAWRQFRKHRLAMAGMVVFVVFLLAVFLGPLFYNEEVNAPFEYETSQGPSLDHVMGTDSLGQDLLARIFFGGRISLSVGLVAALVAISIGTLIGAIAGFFGGFADSMLMRFTDLFISLPTLPLLLLITCLLYTSPSPRDGLLSRMPSSA